MTLGTLSLFQKRGIFYKEWELYSKDLYSDVEASALKPLFSVEENHDIPLKHEVIPIDVSGNTDYITATFEDEGNVNYPYEITVWLLVEDFEREI